MVNDEYTDKEDVVVDKAIKFNNHNNDDGKDNNNKNSGNDYSDGNLYCEVATNKKRKKGMWSKQPTLMETKSVAATKHTTNNSTKQNHNQS